MIQLTEKAIGKVSEILKHAGTETSRAAHLGRGRRLLRIQLFHGFRDPSGNARQDL